MQHKTSLDVARFALRLKICQQCSQRPPHSESLGPFERRECEPRCTIFQNLPALQEAVAIAPAELSGDQLMRRFICPACQCSPSAGDFCADGLARICPLSRYAGDVALRSRSIFEPSVP